MLDRTKVIRELQQLSNKLFLDHSNEHNLAREVWERLAADPAVRNKVRQANAPWPVPTWQGKLDAVHKLPTQTQEYRIAAVDGSQIYPDRHQGTSCFLINVGTVELDYSDGTQPVNFDTNPYVFLGEQQEGELPFSVEVVNCLREEYELSAGLELGKKLKTYSGDHLLAMDGSLIFWHLESKDQQLKETFLNCYLELLQQFYLEDITLASYISLPKSKELVNLIRLGLCDFNINGCELLGAVDHVLDSHVAQFFLEPFSRTTVFRNHSPITAAYPEVLKPHFFLCSRWLRNWAC